MDKSKTIKAKYLWSGPGFEWMNIAGEWNEQTFDENQRTYLKIGSINNLYIYLDRSPTIGNNFLFIKKV